MLSIESGSVERLVGLFADEGMSYTLDVHQEAEAEPSLEEMARIAVEILSRGPNGEQNYRWSPMKQSAGFESSPFFRFLPIRGGW